MISTWEGTERCSILNTIEKVTRNELLIDSITIKGVSSRVSQRMLVITSNLLQISSSASALRLISLLTLLRHKTLNEALPYALACTGPQCVMTDMFVAKVKGGLDAVSALSPRLVAHHPQ